MPTVKKKAFRYTKEQKAWLKDLENTRTKQGLGALHSITDEGHRFCCLGRACVVLKNEGHEIKKEVSPKLFSHRAVCYDGLPASLTNSVRKILGLSGKGQLTCIRMNDSDRWTFKEIAAKIRENPRKFFYKGKS